MNIYTSVYFLSFSLSLSLYIYIYIYVGGCKRYIPIFLMIFVKFFKYNYWDKRNAVHLEHILLKDASFQQETLNQCFFFIVIISSSTTCNLFFSFLYL